MGASGTAPENAPGVAVVLAGGQSRRLGRDKAAVLVDGRPLLERMTGLAGRLCPVVAVSGRDPGPLSGVADWFLDDMPGNGPIGGILTALERYGVSCLVLSCDLPFLDQATLETLLAAWRAKPAHCVLTTFEQIETGYIESLVGVYEPGAAPILREALENGVRKLSRTIPANLRHTVRYRVRDSRPFFNVNTPAELRQVPGAAHPATP